MSPTSFQQAVYRLDELVDEHLGDEFELEVEGVKTTLRGTHATEEVVRTTDNVEIYVRRRRISVQERLIPRRLAERKAIVRFFDPYQPDTPTEELDVIDVERSHSGRVNLILHEP